MLEKFKKKKFLVIPLILVIIVYPIMQFESKQPRMEKNFGETVNCHDRTILDSNKISRCTFGAGKKTVYLVGDSTANMYSTMIRNLASKLNIRLILATAPSCILIGNLETTIIGKDNYLPPYNYSNEFNHCNSYTKATFRLLQESKPNDVVVFSFLDQYFWDDKIVFLDNHKHRVNKSTVINSIFEETSKFNLHKIYILPTPNFRLVNKNNWSDSSCNFEETLMDKCGWKLSKTEMLHKQSAVRDIASRYLTRNFQILDPSENLCQDECRQFSKGKWIFKDFTHLTNFGARLLENDLGYLLTNR